MREKMRETATPIIAESLPRIGSVSFIPQSGTTEARHSCYSRFAVAETMLRSSTSTRVVGQPVKDKAMADILHRVGIKSSPEEVYKALATREGLAGWWTNNTQGESKVGGLLKFRFSAGGSEIGGFDMKILELQPAKRVLWQVVDGPKEWIGTKISFDLTQAGEHTIVLFKHQDWKEPVEFMHHCSTKWAIYLMSLKSLVETRKGSPNPNDTHISGDGPD
jgi:uncharacterized protein YndB with AHSA1/START domain